MARGSGGGGRIRFRAAKSGHAADPQEELVRRRNTTRLAALNSGCFYKSDNLYCPNRLTDFYCVMWTELQETPVPATGGNVTGASAGAELPQSVTLQSTSPSSQPTDTEVVICAGDFSSEQLALINLALPLLLVLTGTVCNLATGRLMVRYASIQLPICYYALAITILDTALLYMRFLDLWFQAAFDLKILLSLMVMDESSCQLLTMLYSSLQHLKSLLQAAMAFETRLLYLKPTSVTEAGATDRVKHGALLSLVIAALVNAHFPWTLTVDRGSATSDQDMVYHCGWTRRWPITEDFTDWVWPIIDLLFSDILPVVAVASACAASLSFIRHRLPECRHCLEYRIIRVDLFMRMRTGLLACCLGHAVLSAPSMLHGWLMYARFLDAGGTESVQGPPSTQPFEIFRPADEESLVYFSRVCYGVQLFSNFLLLAVLVPQFRQDAMYFYSKGVRALNRAAAAISEGILLIWQRRKLSLPAAAAVWSQRWPEEQEETLNYDFPLTVV